MLEHMELDRASLVRKDLEILDLEAQMAAIAERITALQVEKLSVQARLDSYRYPVLTLPNEIVAEIFVQFLPPYPDLAPLAGSLSSTFLTQICHQWREIALTTPMLWRAIKLPSRLMYLEDQAETVTSLLTMWLERSGSCPLSIRIPIGDHGDFPIITSSLVPHFARCEHLSFDVQNTGELSAMDRSMLMLRSLSLVISNSNGGSSLFTFQNTPLLRSVSLSDWAHIPSVVLPWSQLTSLTLSLVYPDACMSVLQQTSVLVDCTLSLWTRDDPQDHFNALTLPYLETLVFQSRSDIAPEFFHSLITPALLFLQLPEGFLNPFPESDVVESLESFINDSGCRLRHLRITCAYHGKEVFQTAFTAISLIEVRDST
ncbi:F-box domain-containing protein [Favolaschia claudopus]|uniref:F-box domain-containing protein n=1 Tax=Favolaschia claudopus TaxID=2862362 RepID=A0AAW0DTD1_9AGAR